MIHPHTQLRFISKEIGCGVVATEFLPAGTITWVLDELDREFTPEQVRELDPLYTDVLDTYSYRNSMGNQILCWDHGRFVNHSFRSNCLSTAYDFEVAIRDIHPGEQLTDDYGYLNLSQPFRPVDEGTRRKTVYPDDLLKYAETWDRKVRKVFPYIAKLQQPLGRLISDTLWREINAVASGDKPMQSIAGIYYGGDA